MRRLISTNERGLEAVNKQDIYSLKVSSTYIKYKPPWSNLPDELLELPWCLCPMEICCQELD
ncbi:hypothetical protein OIU77_008554 [Salix suchowensis]|uniref:Uncharacterized protein n=1 Tax=Salix suchowensis TaxID=1278906 RepID=A0ABQ9AB98_9ROSI|nr:hypothetical protein OIU77_008554 [Salix suchowensis]